MEDVTAGIPKPEKLDSIRRFSKIQDNGRVSIPKEWRDEMVWEDGDQIMVEKYKDCILIHNLTTRWKPKK